MGLGVIAALVVSRTSLRVVLDSVSRSSWRPLAPGSGVRAGPGSVLRRLEPMDRDRPDPAPALRADEAGHGGVRRGRAGPSHQASGPVAGRRATVLLCFMVVAAVLIVKQPDLGTAIVHRLHHLLDALSRQVPGSGSWSCPGAAVLAAGAVVALRATYLRDRLLSFVNPFAHASTSGYQVVGSPGHLGARRCDRERGGGRRSRPGGSSPMPTPTSSSPSSPATWAWWEPSWSSAGFGAFGWAGFRTQDRRQTGAPPRYAAIGVTCWILAQAVINIGGVVDALPVTGIPLPFISYGGSSLVVALIGVGLLFGTARATAGGGHAVSPALWAPAGPCLRRLDGRWHRRPRRTYGFTLGEALVARGHEPSAIFYVGSRSRYGGPSRPRGRFRGGTPARQGHPTAAHPARTSAPASAFSAACVLGLGIVLRRRPGVVVTVGGYAGVPRLRGGLFAGAASRRELRRRRRRREPACRRASLASPPSPLGKRHCRTRRDRGHPPPGGARHRPQRRGAGGRPRGARVVPPTVPVGRRQEVLCGARSLNDAVVRLAKSWAGRGDVTVYHVAGERNLADIEARGLRSRPRPADLARGGPRLPPGRLRAPDAGPTCRLRLRRVPGRGPHRGRACGDRDPERPRPVAGGAERPPDAQCAGAEQARGGHRDR